MVRLDPPSTLVPYEDFHQLRLHYAVGWHDDAVGHALNTAHFVIDVHDRNIRRNKPKPSNDVAFRGASVKRTEDLGMSLRERGCAIHDHPEKIRKRYLRREMPGVSIPIAGVPGDNLICNHGPDLRFRRGIL